MNCPSCQDNDLSLVSYEKLESEVGVVYYQVMFECRQCNHTFPTQLDENEFEQYK